jgi:hypothetical protein
MVANGRQCRSRNQPSAYKHGILELDIFQLADWKKDVQKIKCHNLFAPHTHAVKWRLHRRSRGLAASDAERNFHYYFKYSHVENNGKVIAIKTN